MKKRFLCLLLAAFMAVSIAGCAGQQTAAPSATPEATSEAEVETTPTAAPSAMTPGTYTGTAAGVHDDVTVSMEVSEDEILSVEVVEINDYPIISEKAADYVAGQIVEDQSVSVDALSGATLTSYAIMTAARNALESAGADVSQFDHQEETVLAEGEPESYDVVVVGAGPAGLTAALSAYTDSQFSSETSGLSVLVVESMGFGGGSMGFSGGIVAAYSGTPLNDVTQVSNTVEEVEANFMGWGSTEGMNQTIMDRSIEYVPQVFAGLIPRGFYFDTEFATVNRNGDLTYTTMSTRNPITGDYIDQYDYYTHGGAAWMADSLATLVEEAGVEIRYNTTATELIIDDNVCTGIVVEGPDSTYQINAGKVILCTGFADSNAETASMFFPDRPQSTWSGPAGNTAAAQKWIVELGGEVSIQPKGKATLGTNATIGYFGPAHRIISMYPGVWVNSDGERFFDESGTRNAAVLEGLEEPVAYAIIDSNNPGAADMAPPIYQHTGFVADTIEELAEQIRVPADALRATIDQYNADYEAGGDTLFGTPVESMAPVEEGPFYALTVRLVNTSECVGVYADDDCTIKLGVDGERIENLLGAGGAICNTYLKNGLGAGLATAMTTGTYAGECARTALLGE